MGGTYGVVISSSAKLSGKEKKEKYAIKKVANWSRDWVTGVRILREVKLMQHFSKYPTYRETVSSMDSLIIKGSRIYAFRRCYSSRFETNRRFVITVWLVDLEGRVPETLLRGVIVHLRSHSVVIMMKKLIFGLLGVFLRKCFLEKFCFLEKVYCTRLS